MSQGSHPRVGAPGSVCPGVVEPERLVVLHVLCRDPSSCVSEGESVNVPWGDMRRAVGRSPELFAGGPPGGAVCGTVSPTVVAVFAKLVESLGVGSRDLEVLAARGIVAADDLCLRLPSAERFGGFLEGAVHPGAATTGNGGAIVEVPREVAS